MKIERSLKVAGAAVSLFYLLIATWWLLGIVSPGLAPRLRGQARYRLAKVRRRVRYTWISEAAQVRGEPIWAPRWWVGMFGGEPSATNDRPGEAEK